MATEIYADSSWTISETTFKACCQFAAVAIIEEDKIDAQSKVSGVCKEQQKKFDALLAR